tara:strand:+ start:1391 stop:2758 length:1368 start_codon:yes stop_codon:yes gene_type:complete
MIKTQILEDLDFFKSNNQKLIIWKSFDRLQESVTGRTDFDLFLIDGNFRKFDNISHQVGWAKFKAEKWRSFQGIYDYFKIFKDEKNNNYLIHFHVHETIRTGERFTKSLVLNREIFDNKIEKIDDFYTTDKHLDHELKIIRACFKLTFLDIVISMFRLNSFPIFKYRKEIVCISNNKLSGDDLILDKYISEKSIIKFLVINYKIRKKYRFYKKKRLYKNYYYKLIRSKLSKGGKLTLNKYLFSFIGVDGSGKTTTIDNVYKLLSTQLKVKIIYFGIPKSIKKMRFQLHKFKNFAKKSETKKKINPTSENKNKLIDTFFSTSVSLIKLIKNLQVKIYQIKGYIVLTDRYPVENIIDDLPQWRNSYFNNIEKKLNRIFKEPNKTFLLYADEETLQVRKPDSYQDLKKNKLSLQTKLINSFKSKSNLNLVSLIENSKSKNNNEFRIIKEILEMIANDN